MSAETHIAQWLGAHATTAFFVTLATLWLVVIGAWLLLERVERGRGRGPLPPERILILRMLLGFGIAVGAGMVFAEMVEALDVSRDMGRFDLALTDALRLHLSPATLQMFALVTRLGNVNTLTVLCIVVAVLLLYVSQRRLALAWVLVVAGNGALNVLLKTVFERVRPVREHSLQVSDTGWSFPSGHRSGSVVAYGRVAYVGMRFVPARWHLPLLLLAASLALTVGFSRVFLQVHFLSDVLAGFASGLLWLTICISSTEWLRRNDRPR